jgi:hypothetical protein
MRAKRGLSLVGVVAMVIETKCGASHPVDTSGSSGVGGKTSSTSGTAATAGGAGAGGGAPSGDIGIGVPVVPDGVEPVDAFTADQIAAFCSAALRCHRVATLDGCVKASLPNISPQVVQDVQDNVIQYDPHLGYRCVQMIAKTPCAGAPEYIVSCHYAFKGTLPSGAPCKLNAECVSNACTMKGCTNQCCPPGVCESGTEPRNIPIGGTCTPAGCTEGAYCANGTCAVRPSEGQTCMYNVCQDGLVCYNPHAPVIGVPPPTCVRPAKVGESCAGRPCGADRLATCSPEMICVAPGMAGEACTKPLACELDLNCVNGVCVVPGVLGGPCVGDTGSLQCQAAATAPTAMFVECLAGVCAYRTPLNGQECVSP